MFAYLELGVSSMWIQMAIATLVAAPFFLRDQITRGVNKLRRRGTPDNDPSSNPDS
jgi:hypothetical protein